MKSGKETGRAKISQLIRKRLLLVVVFMFLIIIALTFVAQTKLATDSADEMLDLSIRDAQTALELETEQYIINLCEDILYYDEFQALAAIQSEADFFFNNDLNMGLTYLALTYFVSEISIIDENGIIAYSTNPEYIGFDMKLDSNVQAKDFYDNMLLSDYYIQDYQEISYGSGTYLQYAGMRFPEDCLFSGGFVQLGFDDEWIEDEMSYNLQNLTASRHVGEKGRMFICRDEEEGLLIVSETDRNMNWEQEDRYFDQEMGFSAQNLDALPKRERFEAAIYGEPSYCMYGETDGYYLIATYPKSEVLISRNVSVYITTLMDILVFLMLYVLIYRLTNKLVVRNIQNVNDGLAQITGGNLDVKIDVQDTHEFYSLSEGINATVTALKRYISDAEKRIDQELAYAKTIQKSALPSVFPPYPERKEFDIYASMQAAKEVGGDFYDFYLIGENHLAFIVADVSGKGIPAAMFMMTTKALLKSFAESGMELDAVFTRVNEKLCEDNEAAMFVTAWMGILDLKTGVLQYVNAGHNPPLLKRENGGFEYLDVQGDFILAGMEGIPYHTNELQLMHGDTLYLYTDGVTEATDSDCKLYGEDRLCQVLNHNSEAGMKEICLAVKEDIDLFVGEAPQFDDITMLALKFYD